MKPNPSDKPEPNARPLERAVADTGTVHEVQELSESGIDQVRVLSASRLHDIVRAAVNHVLRDAIDDLDMPRETRQTIATRALGEFGRLARAEAQGLPLVDPEPAAPVEPARVELDVSPISDEFKAFEGRMLQNISSLLDQDDWRSELRTVENNHRSQLDLLERRISKLVQALESTDRLLAHSQQQARTAASGDPLPGVPVDPVSPLTEKKSQLLQALFQANLQLRELSPKEDPSPDNGMKSER